MTREQQAALEHIWGVINAWAPGYTDPTPDGVQYRVTRVAEDTYRFQSAGYDPVVFRVEISIERLSDPATSVDA